MCGKDELCLESLVAAVALGLASGDVCHLKTCILALGRAVKMVVLTLLSQAVLKGGD